MLAPLPTKFQSCTNYGIKRYHSCKQYTSPESLQHLEIYELSHKNYANTYTKEITFTELYFMHNVSIYIKPRTGHYLYLSHEKTKIRRIKKLSNITKSAIDTAVM